MIHTIDLHFHLEGTIASFLIESSAGPILVETGPHSTFDMLEKGIAKCGYKTSDIKHVLLTHIHFDHAGAAWALAQKGATIYVHPIGYPHLLAPERLYNSAKRIYGDQMEKLWGLMKPIPAELLQAVEHGSRIEIGDKTFIALHTPGHASHHIAWQLDDVIFTGDVAGCKVEDGPVVPPCPPPDINLEQWMDSISLLRSLKPSTLYLTHFGKVTAIDSHLVSLEDMLIDWSQWIKTKWEAGLSADEITPLFKAYTKQQLVEAGLDQRAIAQYEAANPAWMSVAGLLRYWKKKLD